MVAGYEDCISYMHSGMANNLRIFSMLRKLICVCVCVQVCIANVYMTI